MAGWVSPTTIVVSASGPAVQIIGELPNGAGAAIKNVGGLDQGKVTPGPDDCWLLFGATTNVPDLSSGATVYAGAFLLLSGDSLTLPADITTVYATAARTRTTLTVVTGIHQ